MISADRECSGMPKAVVNGAVLIMPYSGAITMEGGSGPCGGISVMSGLFAAGVTGSLTQ